jgi:hypothetical protein
MSSPTHKWYLANEFRLVYYIEINDVTCSIHDNKQSAVRGAIEFCRLYLEAGEECTEGGRCEIDRPYVRKDHILRREARVKERIKRQATDWRAEVFSARLYPGADPYGAQIVDEMYPKIGQSPLLMNIGAKVNVNVIEKIMHGNKYSFLERKQGSGVQKVDLNQPTIEL